MDGKAVTLRAPRARVLAPALAAVALCALWPAGATAHAHAAHAAAVRAGTAHAGAARTRSRAAGTSPTCNPRRRPVASVIVIHGGGFVWPGWADLSLCRALARHGFRAVNLVYPLHDLPGAVHATMRATRRERKRGLPVAALGLSVGGTLAELAAEKGRVDAAVAVAGPTDLLHWAPGGSVADEQWSDAAAYWRDVGATHAQRLAASPIRHTSTHSAPMLLFHSPADEVVPIAQSRALVRRLPGTRLRLLRGQHLQSQAFRAPALDWLRRRLR
jgi:hypothetical protein